MKTSNKMVYIGVAATLVFTAFFTTQAFQPEERFDLTQYVEIESVQDWPPISSTSPLYSGSEYTQLGARNFFQYISPKGLVARDSLGNRYFIPGYEHVNTRKYELHQSNRNRHRLCDERDCITITSIEPTS